MWQAAAEVFPTVVPLGCFFHWCQAYGIKYKSLVCKEHIHLMKKLMATFVNFCHYHISHVSILDQSLKGFKKKL